MQDRYVGDLGDFGKYGLLNQLAGDFDAPDHLRLGVFWYLVPDESHNEDGKHIGYLNSPISSRVDQFRCCNPALYDGLADIVSRGERAVTSVRQSHILPPDTVFFEDALSFSHLPKIGLSALSRRLQHREEWFLRGQRCLQPCDLIFLDPDNGLEVKSVARCTRAGPKYVFLDEIAGLLQAGKSLVIYHHLCRTGTAPEQIERNQQRLQELCHAGERIWACVYKRGTLRTFFVVAQPRHAQLLVERTQRMMTTPWARHFSWYGCDASVAAFL